MKMSLVPVKGSAPGASGHNCAFPTQKSQVGSTTSVYYSIRIRTKQLLDRKSALKCAERSSRSPTSKPQYWLPNQKQCFWEGRYVSWKCAVSPDYPCWGNTMRRWPGGIHGTWKVTISVYQRLLRGWPLPQPAWPQGRQCERFQRQPSPHRRELRLSPLRIRVPSARPGEDAHSMYRDQRCTWRCRVSCRDVWSTTNYARWCGNCKTVRQKCMLRWSSTLSSFPGVGRRGGHLEITVSASLDTTDLTKSNFGLIFIQLSNSRWYRLRELPSLKSSVL